MIVLKPVVDTHFEDGLVNKGIKLWSGIHGFTCLKYREAPPVFPAYSHCGFCTGLTGNSHHDHGFPNCLKYREAPPVSP